MAQELEDRGYKDVHALYGGFGAWVTAGLPLEPRAAQESYSRDA